MVWAENRCKKKKEEKKKDGCGGPIISSQALKIARNGLRIELAVVVVEIIRVLMALYQIVVIKLITWQKTNLM